MRGSKARNTFLKTLDVSWGLQVCTMYRGNSRNSKSSHAHTLTQRVRLCELKGLWDTLTYEGHIVKLGVTPAERTRQASWWHNIFCELILFGVIYFAVGSCLLQDLVIKQRWMYIYIYVYVCMCLRIHLYWYRRVFTYIDMYIYI